MAVPARVLSRALGVLLGALVALAVLPVGAQASSASDFVSRINAARSSQGAAPLAVRGDLAAVAQAQAERMADRSELFHNPNLAGSVSHWSLLGENVGYGPDAATIHQAFMNSAPHRKNILNEAYTEIGVGVVFRDHVMWVSEVFRKPTGTSSSGGGSSSGSKGSGSGGSSSGSHSSSKATSHQSGSQHSSSTSHATSAAGSHRSASTSARKQGHRQTAKHPRRHVTTSPRPPFRAVSTAGAAAAAMPRVQVTPLTWTTPADEPLHEDPLPTAAFVSLGVLALVLVGAATRVRLF